MVSLPPEVLSEFQAIFQKTKGKSIEGDDLALAASAALELCAFVYKPVKREHASLWHDIVKTQPHKQKLSYRYEVSEIK